MRQLEKRLWPLINKSETNETSKKTHQPPTLPATHYNSTNENHQANPRTQNTRNYSSNDQTIKM